MQALAKCEKKREDRDRQSLKLFYKDIKEMESRSKQRAASNMIAEKSPH